MSLFQRQLALLQRAAHAVSHRSVLVVSIGLLALGVVLPGLSARDFTGDELAIFPGGPLDIARLAMDPSEPFTGHMPLSYWLRWCVRAVVGETSWVAWRLHAAVGFALTAVVTVWGVSHRGWAVVAGGLLALSPVLSFHGMESANYALTALLGAVVMVGLFEPQARHRWWVFGLLLAAWNDLYSLWLGVGALAVLWWHPRTQRVGLLRPVVLMLGLSVPVVVMVLWRMVTSGEAATIGMHADLAMSDIWSFEVLFGQIQRFGGAAISGYASGREGGLWDRLPSLFFPLLAALAALRSGHHWGRVSGILLLGGLSAVTCASWVMAVGFGRVLPSEPRVLVGLMPALAVSVAAGLSVLRRPGMLGAVIALGLCGGATLQQQLNRSTLHTDVAEHVLARLGPAERVVAPPRIRDRFLAAGLSPSRVVTCIDAMPHEQKGLWWVQAQPIEHPFEWLGCYRGDGTTDVVDRSGWRIVETWTAGPPEHERNGAGFVRPVAAFHFEAGSALAERSPTGELHFSGSLLDGLDGATIETEHLEPDGSWPSLDWFTGGDEAEVSLVQLPLSRVRVRARPPYSDWLPEWSLLDPYRRDVQAWELMLIDPQLQGASWTLPAAAMRAPGWQVLQRLASAVLVLLFGAVALRGRRS